MGKHNAQIVLPITFPKTNDNKRQFAGNIEEKVCKELIGVNMFYQLMVLLLRTQQKELVPSGFNIEDVCY